MSVNLTEDQKLAVGCRHGSLIVSAAAGAGKTAVLVRRVLGLITDPEDPCGVDELLVVTFTNAAAGEMRQRIGEELRSLLAEHPDDARLRRQLALLGSSRIQTVHAFCQSLVREHFALCGVEPDFALADETQSELLKEQALSDVLEEAYQQDDPAFRQLCDNLTDGRTDRTLSAAILEIYEKMSSHPDPDRLLSFLPTYCTADVESSTWVGEMRKRAAGWLSFARRDLEKTIELAQEVDEVYGKYGPLLEKYDGFAAEMLKAIETGWDAAVDCISGFENGRLPACRYEDKSFLERIKAGRKRFTDCIALIRKECFTQTAAEIHEEGLTMEPMVRALCSLIRAFSARFQEEKRRRGLLDFSDLEHYALRLLTDENNAPSELARTLCAGFREILVDEYQDTNEIQEDIFRSLRQAGDSAFFVGDVKQSIYRFRLAEPEIFLDRYRNSVPYTGAETGSLRLSLNKNFRSRPEVLSLCNAVFSRVMSADFGDVDYDEDQRLNAGRPAADGTVPSEVLLLDCPHDPELGEQEARGVLEARLAAKRVQRLLREERVPEGDGTRPARPEDIAILLSSFANKAPVFRQELQNLGIPCGTGGGTFFGTVETSVLLSVLRILLNRRQDIPLISVLRSPLYFAPPDLLARLRVEAPEGDLIDGLELCAETEPLCRKVLEDLDRWSAQAQELPVSRLIRLICDETGAEGVFAALDNGVQRVLNLQRLENMARPFDGSAGGLAAFLRWIDRKIADGEQPDSTDSDASGVQLLSIHRSKGLEFPFVIVPDLAKRFNMDDLNRPVLFHLHLGIGLRIRSKEQHAEHSARLQQAIVQRMRHELRSEELRKLYVAMTRAREKLILIMSSKTMEKTVGKILDETEGRPSPEWLVQQTDAMSWLIAALLTHPACGELRAADPGRVLPADDSRAEDLICRIIHADDLETAPSEAAPAAAPDAPETAEERDYAPLIARSLLDYPHRKASELPSKVTATGLRALLEPQNAVCPPDSAEGEEEHYSMEPPDPRALLRGTAMHALLEHADFARCTDEQAVLEQAKAFAAKGWLSPEMLELTRPGPVVAFAQSALGKRAQSARRVLREYEFSVLLDAGDLLPEGPTGEKLLLNGAIDLLLFEEDGMTVIDFKTDRVEPEQAAQKAEEHRRQLSLYARAAEEIFGLPVRERWVWFLRIGRGVPLN